MKSIQLQETVKSIQHQSVESLLSLNNFNQMMHFQLNFQSTFVPVLEYLVENGEEDQIAQAMNFGYFISELSYFKFRELYLSSLENEDYIKLNIKNKKAYENIKNVLANKSSEFFSVLLNDLSTLVYNLILLNGIDKFDVMNYLIGSANISNSILRAPLIAQTMIDEEDIVELLDGIKNCKNIINESGGIWDMTFSGKKNYPSVVICDDPNRYLSVEKYPLCSKYSYLKGITGLELALFLKNGKNEHFNNAKIYHDKLLDCLESSKSNNVEYVNEKTCRDFDKNSSFLYEDFINDYNSIIPITSHQILVDFEPNQKKYVELIPNLGFYLSEDEIAKPQLLYNFYKHTAHTIFQNTLSSKGIESKLYKNELENRDRINKIGKDKSLQILAELTFGQSTNLLGVFFEQFKPIKKSVSVIFGIAAFYGTGSTISLLNLASGEAKELLQLVAGIISQQIYETDSLDKKVGKKIKDMQMFYTPSNTDLQTYLVENRKLFFNELNDLSEAFGIGEFYKLNMQIKQILLDDKLETKEKLKILSGLITN